MTVASSLPFEAVAGVAVAHYPADGLPMRRVAIVGSTAAGKTTLAAQLGQQLGLPHVALDGLYWDAGWRPASREVFRERVAGALARPG